MEGPGQGIEGDWQGQDVQVQGSVYCTGTCTGAGMGTVLNELVLYTGTGTD